MSKHVVFCLFLCLGVISCATMPNPAAVTDTKTHTSNNTSVPADTQTDSAGGAGTKGADSPRGPIRASLMRYAGSNVKNWDGSQDPRNFSQYYTRITVTSKPAAGVQTSADQDTVALRDYAAEKPDWLTTLVIDRTKTVTLVANVSVNAPDLQVTIPLYSVTHASGRKLGNTWQSNYTSSNLQSPLFLISSNSVLAVTLKSDISSDLKSQGVSGAIYAITKAVDIAAPKASLLTPLSSDDVKSTATALDTTISELNASAISEKIDIHREISSWRPTSEIEIVGCAPFVRIEQKAGRSGAKEATEATETTGCSNRPDVDGHGDTTVGLWHLTLACPRVSIYDARTICRLTDPMDFLDDNAIQSQKSDIASQVTDAAILAFQLTNQITVRDFVKGQDWFSTFIGLKAPKDTDYETFCHSFQMGLEAQGLNGFDSALVLRAAIRSLPQLTLTRSEFARGKAGAKCVDLLSYENAPLK